MEKKVLKFIKKNKMLQYGDSVVLGVSGGADSLCMLAMLHKFSEELNLTITAVHVNHHIRGEEADKDQKYVEDFCKNISVKCKVVHIQAEQLAKELKCSEEEAGRIARYEIFEKTLKEENADKIAVAHNLNDSSETILFNLFRGSGIKGISGIMPVRDNIIRPILCLERKEIEKYLKYEGISYCTDSTNLDDNYTRNKIRNNVIPYLETNINKNAVLNIVKAGLDLAETENYLDEQTKMAYGRFVIEMEKSYLIKADVLQEHPVIQKRIIRSIISLLSGKLKDVTRLHVESVMELFEKSTGSMSDLPYRIKAYREYEGVKMFVADNEEEKFENDFTDIVIYKEGEAFSNEYVITKKLKQENFNKNIPEIMYTKWIDCDKIKDTLVVRKRRTGDYVTIDDKGNTKKLKDYFINEKVPKQERDEILIIADGSHVVWIIGYRLGSYYKITDATTNVLQLEFNEKNYNLRGKKDGRQN